MDQTHERFQFFRAAGIVSAGVSLSRVTGLVREMAMARLFGAGEVYDAFLLGSRLPNLTRNLFAEGALSAAFVPVFTRVLTAQGKRQAAELSSVLARVRVRPVAARRRQVDEQAQDAVLLMRPHPRQDEIGVRRERAKKAGQARPNDVRIGRARPDAENPILEKIELRRLHW